MAARSLDILMRPDYETTQQLTLSNYRLYVDNLVKARAEDMSETDLRSDASYWDFPQRADDLIEVPAGELQTLVFRFGENHENNLIDQISRIGHTIFAWEFPTTTV